MITNAQMTVCIFIRSESVFGLLILNWSCLHAYFLLEDKRHESWIYITESWYKWLFGHWSRADPHFPYSTFYRSCPSEKWYH